MENLLFLSMSKDWFLASPKNLTGKKEEQIYVPEDAV